MNYTPGYREALDTHCREVIRSCLNIVEQHGDTYVAIHKDDEIDCVVLVSMIRSYPIMSIIVADTFETPPTEYGDKITELAEFLMHLLTEREKLSAAIHKAKAGLELDAGLDGEVSLNSKRQDITRLFRHMVSLRNGEVLIPNGGTGYRFNNEGNQVSYRCDVKRVTTINFDRNKIRKMLADLSKKSDETSAALDAALINTVVEYEVPFDVNETFAEAFEAYAGIEPKA